MTFGLLPALYHALDALERAQAHLELVAHVLQHAGDGVVEGVHDGAEFALEDAGERHTEVLEMLVEAWDALLEFRQPAAEPFHLLISARARRGYLPCHAFGQILHLLACLLSLLPLKRRHVLLLVVERLEHLFQLLDALLGVLRPCRGAESQHLGDDQVKCQSNAPVERHQQSPLRLHVHLYHLLPQTHSSVPRQET